MGENKEIVATEEEIKENIPQEYYGLDNPDEEVEILDLEEPIGFTESDEEMTLENKEEE